MKMNVDDQVHLDAREAVLRCMDGMGMKGVQLVADVSSHLHKRSKSLSAAILVEELNEMVKDGDLIEIEYTNPSMPDRVKSFYLPKGSRILSILGTNILDWKDKLVK